MLNRLLEQSILYSGRETYIVHKESTFLSYWRAEPTFAHLPSSHPTNRPCLPSQTVKDDTMKQISLWVETHPPV
uniref:Uncharacterized protein n=1 Tax=Picea glauca TaxID=3330 RepID=A0A117NHF4_PICGL|nr:hypothetical protein ABT39_MTgene5262 [Picea glauca]QHR88810.1 hypothetical protein Q903MT_gene2826 [Picea sitchensis]